MTATLRRVDILTAARAEALFCAPVCCDEPIDRAAADQLIRTQAQLRGCRGCAETVALEYGDHPLEAAARMAWALATVRTHYRRKAA